MEKEIKNKILTASNAKKALIAGASVVAMSSAVIGSAQAATTAAPASAIMLAPIALTPVAMHFGSFTADTGGAGGAIVLAPDGARTLSGGTGAGDLTLISAGGGTAAVQGVIDIDGANNATVLASVAAGAVTATRGGVSFTDGYALSDGVADTVAVGSFIVQDTGTTTNANDTVTVTLSAAGDGDINVGATLLVDPDDAAGTYTGTYTVSVVYN